MRNKFVQFALLYVGAVGIAHTYGYVCGKRSEAKFNADFYKNLYRDTVQDAGNYRRLYMNSLDENAKLHARIHDLEWRLNNKTEGP